MGLDVDDYLARLRSAPAPPMSIEALPAIRERFTETLSSGYPKVEVGLVTDRDVEVGEARIRVRLYGAEAPGQPTVLFFHGGGFVIGSLESHDGLCRDLCRRTGWRVVSVDYRLAPEHRYPAALDDGLAAFDWLVALTDGPIVVMGDSAGGWIAAQIALRRPAALQVLLYPALDLSASRPSHRAFAEGFGLNAQAIGFCYDCFIDPGLRTLGEVSPLLLDSPPRPCPALIVVGGRDCLRDEALAYASWLAVAGADVDLRVVARMIHGFVTSPKVFDDADVELERLVVSMREQLVRSGVLKREER